MFSPVFDFNYNYEKGSFGGDKISFHTRFEFSFVSLCLCLRELFSGCGEILKKKKKHNRLHFEVDPRMLVWLSVYPNGI